MKHAYLILAHNEFEVLQRLINELDVPSNDIYIHFDAKVSVLPELTAHFSKISILPDRIKTYWGDVSLVNAELKLFETAIKSGPYQYYHLISGTHFPLMSSERIRDRFDSYNGKSVLQQATISPGEIQMRFGKYHLFADTHPGFKNFLWRASLKIQDFFPRRDTSHISQKASQWCSLCHKDAVAIVCNKDRLIRLFLNTFCCDEYFMPTALAQLGIDFVWESKLTYLVFEKANPVYFKSSQFDEIMHSGCIFARKFNLNSMDLIDRICQSTHT